MQTKTTYIANDGIEFDNEEDCKLYESNLSVLQNMNSIDMDNIYHTLALIKFHCATKEGCNTCSFKNILCGRVHPTEWDIPEKYKDLNAYSMKTSLNTLAKAGKVGHWYYYKDSNTLYCSNCHNPCNTALPCNYCSSCDSYQIEPTIEIPKCSCFYTDGKGDRCKGTRECDFCDCDGILNNCSFYTQTNKINNLINEQITKLRGVDENDKS